MEPSRILRQFRQLQFHLREAPTGGGTENTNEHDPATMDERRDRGLAARRRLGALPQRLQRTET